MTFLCITLEISQKKPEYNINSVNPLYLLIDEIDGFIEEIKNVKQDQKY